MPVQARVTGGGRLLVAGQSFAVADRALGRTAAGPLSLKDPRIAGQVAAAIHIGEWERQFYDLHAWVIMPNHVHLLVLPKKPLRVITRWLKGSTARAANRLLGRQSHPFWQDESYDHWVRSQREFDRIVRYIEENPVSAGLVGSAELWRWSSATSNRRTDASANRIAD